MDPHLLRTFGEVARLRSFSAAARALGYTQSAVSQHIAALEADLGVPLLSRRPVVPTEAGARLLDHTGPLLARLAAARADVVRVARSPRARLALGAAPLAFGPAAAGALARVRAGAPRARVSVRWADTAGVVRDLLAPERESEAADQGTGARTGAGGGAGALDVGFVAGVAAPTDPLRVPGAAGLRVTSASEEPLCVVLPPGHPLAGRAGLRLADLADALWLDASGAVPLAPLRAATGGGFPVSVHCDGADPTALRALAEAGQGLALLPRSVAGDGAVPLVEPRLVHRVEVLTAHRPSDLARALVDELAAAGGPPARLP